MSVPGDAMGLGRCDFRMFEPSLKDSFVTRFVRVILLNVQASFWVAIRTRRGCALRSDRG